MHYCMVKSPGGDHLIFMGGGEGRGRDFSKKKKIRRGFSNNKIARTTKERKKDSQDHIKVKAETDRILFQDI